MKLELIATDLEVSAKIILNAKIEIEGSFCINSKNISAACQPWVAQILDFVKVWSMIFIPK